MPRYDKWYVITGGPSTGKTSLLKALAKLGYATVDEAARLLIDEAVAKGVTANELRDDEKKFQEDTVNHRLKLEARAAKDKITFLDRGMQDSLAYFRYYDFHIEPWIMDVIAQTTYKQVFLMEPLGIFKKDYARTETIDFTDYITDILMAAYREYGMEPILVPPVSIAERVEIVLKASGLNKLSKAQ